MAGRTGFSLLAMTSVAVLGTAASAQDWRCDCSRVVAKCTAQISVEDDMAHFRSSTRACSRIEYFLDGEYRTTTIYDGFAAQPFRRPATAAAPPALRPSGNLQTPVAPLPGAAPLPPAPGATPPPLPPSAAAQPLPPSSAPLPPVGIRIASCRVCYDSAVEYGRRGAAGSGDGKFSDPQCAAAAAETQRLIQECAANVNAGIVDYGCTNRLIQANNRMAALCN